jgi:hypothetical protein
VVIDDFHVLRASGRPDETNSPLPDHADAVLAFAIALQGFEAVVRSTVKR